VKRYAHVKPRWGDDADRLTPYLPDNYELMAVVSGTEEHDGFVIRGEDVAGWTLDGYVIPRLASGMWVAEEIDLSHPVMKRIPA
jgi:hypothetical protein